MRGKRKNAARKSGAGGSALEAVPPVIHQRQKFVARLFARAKRTQHRARHGTRVLLLHPAHHHAEVPGLADYPYPQRVDSFLNRLPLPASAVPEFAAAWRMRPPRKHLATGDCNWNPRTHND